MTNRVTIDATNKKPGRVASEAAIILMGKKNPAMKKGEVEDVSVEITNAAKADFDLKKLVDKKYLRYSGYPGGLKEISLKQMIDKSGAGKVFWLAIRGMLPNNKLRVRRMKKLIIKE